MVDINQLAGLGGFPVVFAFVQLLKAQTPPLQGYYAIGASFVFSLVWEVGCAFAFHTDLFVSFLYAIVVCLAAMGVYSGYRTSTGKGA